jgi:hypothetical protein
MSSYSVLKKNKNTGKVTFLMANALGTKTFKDDISNAWTDYDHRIASDMMLACSLKHRDTDKFIYFVDDLDESPEW